jgi:hypothetical protein
MCRRDNPKGFWRTDQGFALIIIFCVMLGLMSLSLVGYISSLDTRSPFYNNCTKTPDIAECNCNKSYSNQTWCIAIFTMAGYLVALVIGLSLVIIFGIVLAIFILAKYIIEGIIETYKQADTVYLNSLTKKT